LLVVGARRMSSVVGSATPFVVEDVVVVSVPAAFKPTSLNSVPSACTPATVLPLRQL
jgi:peroxiredoxin